MAQVQYHEQRIRPETLQNNFIWNTSRCSRLLRPIASKLEFIRRETAPRVAFSKLDRNVSRTSSRKAKAHRNGQDDEEWTGNKPNRPLKRKYSGRQRSQQPLEPEQKQRKSIRDLTLPPGLEHTVTPLLVHAIRIKTADSNTRGTLHSNLETAIEKNMETSKNDGIMGGLCGSFDALLRVTRPGACENNSLRSHNSKKSGASSLFEICLRKVPQYIAVEQEFRSEESPEEQGDASTEIYASLEHHFESSNGRGWAPFREVVRWHAVSLLCEAITDSLLDPMTTVKHLIYLCIYQDAYDEAQELLGAVVASQPPLEVPRSCEVGAFATTVSPALNLLDEFSEYGDFRAFRYRCVTSMLISGVLPLNWLGTYHFTHLWSHLLNAVDEGCSSSIAASELIEVALTCAAGVDPLGFMVSRQRKHKRGRSSRVKEAQSYRYLDSGSFVSPLSVAEMALQDALRSTATGICSAMVAMLLWSNDYMKMSRESLFELVLRPLRNSAIQVSRQYQDTAWSTSAMFSGAALTALTILTADLIASMNGLEVGSETASKMANHCTEQLARLSSVASTDKVYTSAAVESMTSVVCSISRAWGLQAEQDGFDMLQHTVGLLEDAFDKKKYHPAWLPKRLALESALAFANISKDPNHKVFARNIEFSLEDNIFSKNDTPLMKRKREPNDTKSSRFRWEEGICEWVAATPASQHGHIRMRRSLSNERIHASLRSSFNTIEGMRALHLPDSQIRPSLAARLEALSKPPANIDNGQAHRLELNKLDFELGTTRLDYDLTSLEHHDDYDDYDDSDDDRDELSMVSPIRVPVTLEVKALGDERRTSNRLGQRVL